MKIIGPLWIIVQSTETVILNIKIFISIFEKCIDTYSYLLMKENKYFRE